MIFAEIIPESFFHGQASWMLWVLTGAGIALLVYGADRTVGSAARLAATLGLSKVIIGATVVSLGTTSPEAVVSVKAAWQGDPGLALGNGVGSIICDTAMIFGLCCLIRRLPIDRFVLNRHGWLQLGSGTLLAGTALVFWAISGDINNVVIPRGVGLVFVALLIGYMCLSVHWSKRHPEMIPDEAAAVSPPKDGKVRQALGNLALLAFGLALVVGGSEVLIGSVKEIAVRFDVPQAVIAVTLVAFGTSLPELVTAIASLVKGHSGLLVGNIIGADILNVLFVIGASAVARPLKVHPLFFSLFLPVMMAALILLRVYIFTSGSSFRRWQGVPLLAIYVVFTILTVAYGAVE